MHVPTTSVDLAVVHQMAGRLGLAILDRRELERLQSVEAAWSAVFFALKTGNPDAFQRPMTGVECAIAEIKRLYAATGPGVC